MNKLTSWLGGLLALQLVLAAGLFWGDGAGQSEAIGQPLLEFEQAQIDKVVIGAGEEEVTLQRQDGQWRLPGQSDLPVDSGKLQPLLEQLHGLQSGWPVATSASSHQRFEVSEDTHQRRIRLFRDGQLVVDLYLGTSPGFKKVHGRRAADTEVYALPLNSFDFPTSANNWLDKALLAAGDIKRIEGADFSLQKDEQGWALVSKSGAEPAPQLDQEKAGQLGRALSSLQVTGVAKAAPEFAPEQVIALEVEGAERWQYQLLQQDDQYYIRRNDVRRNPGSIGDAVFTLNKYDFDRIAGIGLADLQATGADEVTERPATDEAGEGEGKS